MKEFIKEELNVSVNETNNENNLQETTNITSSISFLNQLPVEIIGEILKYLDIVDLCRLMQANKYFSELTSQYLSTQLSLKEKLDEETILLINDLYRVSYALKFKGEKYLNKDKKVLEEIFINIKHEYPSYRKEDFNEVVKSYEALEGDESVYRNKIINILNFVSKHKMLNKDFMKDVLRKIKSNLETSSSIHNDRNTLFYKSCLDKLDHYSKSNPELVSLPMSSKKQ